MPESRNKLRECIESLVIAGGLALVIRGFVVEAFVVPTGSMAPAIYGRNLAITCGSCGHHFAVKWGWGARRRPQTTECPRCGEPIEPTWFAFSRGDRLLVNKFLHRIRGLSRWEIVVFWCPDPSIRKNYIKRLVGLPGEEIQVRGGDLYVNGRIERKPSHVQDTMWVPLSDDHFEDKLWAGSWSLESGQCDVGTGVLRLLGPDGPAGTAARRPSNDDVDICIRYSRPIDDFVVYNAGSDDRNGGYPPEEIHVEDARPSFGKTPVGDIELRIEANIPDGAGVVADLADNRGAGEGRSPALRFVVRAGDGTSSITDALGNTAWEGRLDLAGGPHVVECSNVDAALYLSVDGDVRASREYAPLPEGARPSPTAAVGAVGGRVDLSRISLYRDTYYCSVNSAFTTTYGVDRPYRLSERSRDPDTGEMVGENEYFFLGDNSRSSRDCRMLDLQDYPIVEKYIRGKALIRFWPPRRMGLIK
jgi:signal peptidase I